jgi:hypothetical protein
MGDPVEQRGGGVEASTSVHWVDLYLRRSHLALFLNGTGYQESKLES